MVVAADRPNPRHGHREGVGRTRRRRWRPARRAASRGGRGMTIDPRFGPLEGVRVLDLTIALAGAFSTMLLADLGAEVIKIESLQHYPTPTKGPRRPPRGDDAVSMSAKRDYPDGDPGADPWNRLSWFNAQARNKRDVTMDLTREPGRSCFWAW